MFDLNLNLGIDFGTSFTKVVVRDSDQENSWIINFSQNNSQLRDALLPTKVGICNDGTLVAGLTTDEWERVSNLSMSIDFIKMRLANLDLVKEGQGHISDSLPYFDGIDVNTAENLENLCAYYLSKVIIKAQKWVFNNNTELVKNQNISWSINIGVPVKYFDSNAITRFKKVLRLAWLLTDKGCENIHELQNNIDVLRNELEDLENKYADDQIPIPCFAFPEIGAAVYSYTASRQAKEGTYLFFDVGSGTIEGSAFHFWREDGQSKVEFYSGEVEAIGLDAMAKQIALKLQNSEKEISNALIHNSELFLDNIDKFSKENIRQSVVGYHRANANYILLETCQTLLESVEDFESKQLLHLIMGQYRIHREIATVICTCKKKIPDYFNNLLKNSRPLVIFLGGGAAKSEFYRDTIEKTYKAFGHENSSIPVYDVQDVPFPKDLNMSGLREDNFDRFAIAYGLSIPDYEAPEVKGFPSQFSDAPPQARYLEKHKDTGY